MIRMLAPVCGAITRIVLRLLAWRIRRDPQAGALTLDVLRRGGRRKPKPNDASRVKWSDEA